MYNCMCSEIDLDLCNLIVQVCRVSLFAEILSLCTYGAWFGQVFSRDGSINFIQLI